MHGMNNKILLILALMYLLTAIGLTPGGSSAVHIYTQTIHRTNTNNTQNKHKYTKQHKQYTELHKQYTELHKQYTEQTQTIHRTIYLGRLRAVPRLCQLHPGICLTTEEKTRINLTQGSRRVPVGTMKTKHREQNTHNNKNK